MGELRIGIVVLAAGFGRRFGGDKRQAMLPGGTPVLTQTLRHAAPAFSERLLVLREEDEALRRQHADWPSIVAEDAALGLGHSLAAAMPHVSEWDGMVVALGDMPWVSTATYIKVKEATKTDSLVLPHHQGQRGNPVGIGNRFFSELMTPRGDKGARALFAQHEDALVGLEVDDAGILRDIDVPEDLQ